MFSDYAYLPITSFIWTDSLIEAEIFQLKNGGQGIFAQKNLPPNSIVAFYNGVRFNDCHVRISNCKHFKLLKCKDVSDMIVHDQVVNLLTF